MSRLRHRSVAELLGRGGQAVRILLERAGVAPLPRAPIGMRICPALPFPQLSSPQLESAYHRRPAERAALLDHADAALAGRFHLLGLRDLDFGHPVEWHLDPTRQRRAPGGHWSQVPYLDESRVGDHKIVWELNRHQWLVTLAQAWRLTEDRRYLERIAEALDEWLLANPPRQGINWASSLELAYRAIAWTWILHLTAASLPDPQALHRRLLDSLVQHGDQVERHLSTWFSPNTHLTGEALGLLYLGVAWPDLPQARRWRESGWRILLAQLPLQVRPDGSYFEQATWYQAYTADLYLHGILLARAAGLAVPGWAEEKIAGAAMVVAELVRPDGTLPLIGDDDGGRLLPLTPVRTDFRDTVALAAVVFHRPETCSLQAVPAATAWLVGTGPWEAIADVPPAAQEPQSRAFREGGWFLLRGATGAMILDAGPHGALSGGHSHADALALDLTVGRHPVLVDPGTGAYVGPWRDRLRATSAHNTLCLADGTGSATPTGPFRWGKWPRVTLRHWSDGPGWAAVEAEHDGFGQRVPGLVHRRTVVFVDGRGWLVLDRLLGAEAGSLVRFQVDPGVGAELQGGIVSVLSAEGLPLLRIIPDGLATVTLGVGLVSPAYGAAVESPAVIRRLTAAEGRQGAVTLLGTRPDAVVARAAAGFAWTWSEGDWMARLAVGADGVTTFESDDLSLTLD